MKSGAGTAKSPVKAGAKAVAVKAVAKPAATRVARAAKAPAAKAGVVKPEEGEVTSSLREQVYEDLRYRLITGKIAPGVGISTRGLAQQMGVSQMPVRDALSRIAAEGACLAAFLFDAVDQVGQFVAVAAGDAGEKALTREAAGDGAAGRVSGTDDQGDFGFRHGRVLPMIWVAA